MKTLKPMKVVIYLLTVLVIDTLFHALMASFFLRLLLILKLYSLV